MIGIDEVGRGAWAGPLLVVAARQVGELSGNIKDSKLLKSTVRSSLVPGIRAVCDIGEGWVMPAEIDRLGMREAMRLAVARALEAVKARYNETIITDGSINYCEAAYYKASAVIGADKEFPVVSAASIVAKVARDTFMRELPSRYEAWEFDRHVGYGTPRHQVLLRRHGVSDIHRTTFKPIKEML